MTPVLSPDVIRCNHCIIYFWASGAINYTIILNDLNMDLEQTLNRYKYNDISLQYLYNLFIFYGIAHHC